ncbi:response regulator [Paraflavitalea speifideaquila]|uniref:response regulator n=1 Tax=Paraflavitalea speifideaquila TaxID=3076558 RepID=UPI0028E57E42|nr:response regulator [Paraflavitalea speifideiaquila]
MSTRPSILLVEDEENLHEALKLNLELEGYEVTSAFTGSEALQKVQDEYFDLLILDVMLPELDGISVTETIRVQNNEVPILILSAKNASSDRVLGLKRELMTTSPSLLIWKSCYYVSKN